MTPQRTDAAGPQRLTGAPLESVLMVDRRKHLAAVRGSSALEGLKASEDVELLLDRWAAGEATDADLEAAVRRIIEAANAKAQAS